MRTFPIKVGKGKGALTVDAATLLTGRMLIQGASNSGKSYLLRLVAEQTIGRLQTIIIDADGEFLSLREKCDVILAGKDGDVPAEIRSARLLARRIAETGASTVVDLSDLKLDDRRSFVRIFLDTLDGLPRSLWASRIIAVDEAHKLAPESGKGKAESTDAVITLMSQGRKRGHCGILLTQRLSKLKKDAAAECANVFIGKTSPIDLSSAQDMLGVLREDRDALRHLSPGEFFAGGPALSSGDVVRFQARRSITTHPEPGSRHQMEAPPSRKAIERILPAFEELPPDKEDEEAQDLANAKAEIRDLKRQLQSKKADRSSIQKAVDDAAEKWRKKQREYHRKVWRSVESSLKKMKHASENISAATDALEDVPRDEPEVSTPSVGESVGAQWSPGRRIARGGSERMLAALAAYGPLSRTELAHIAMMAPSSGTFSNYLSNGRVSGLLEVDGGNVAITDAGASEVDGVEPPPTGEALVEKWCAKLPTGAAQMLRAIVDTRAGIGRTELARTVGMTPGSGTFSNYLSKLRKLQLVSRKPPFVPARTLLE